MNETIHIVDRFSIPWSGSAFETIALWEMLSGHADARLWAVNQPDECFRNRPIRFIDNGSLPTGGTLVIAGAQFSPGPWLEAGDFHRIIIKINSPELEAPLTLIRRIRLAGLPQPELVFPSALLRDLFALDGLVEPSLISLRQFSPPERKQVRTFTLGRLSRDHEFKHHEDDLSLYRMLALQGHRVRVMGGTCLEPHLGRDRKGIELIPAGSEAAWDFLRGLDCFFYRTHPSCLEAFGRVVVEAMATGLPVVCECRGGYAELIEHGVNGYLFDTQEEAWNTIQQLISDDELRLRIGFEARRSVKTIYSSTNVDLHRAWYLGHR